MEPKEVDFSDIAAFLENLSFRKTLLGAPQADIFACMKDLDLMYHQKVEEVQKLYEDDINGLEEQLKAAQGDCDEAKEVAQKKEEEAATAKQKYAEQMSQLQRQNDVIRSLRRELDDAKQGGMYAGDSARAEETARMMAELQESNEQLKRTLRSTEDQMGQTEKLSDEYEAKLKAKEAQLAAYSRRLEEAKHQLAAKPASLAEKPAAPYADDEPEMPTARRTGRHRSEEPVAHRVPRYTDADEYDVSPAPEKEDTDDFLDDMEKYIASLDDKKGTRPMSSKWSDSEDELEDTVDNHAGYSSVQLLEPDEEPSPRMRRTKPAAPAEPPRKKTLVIRAVGTKGQH